MNFDPFALVINHRAQGAPFWQIQFRNQWVIDSERKENDEYSVKLKKVKVETIEIILDFVEKRMQIFIPHEIAEIVGIYYFAPPLKCKPRSLNQVTFSPSTSNNAQWRKQQKKRRDRIKRRRNKVNKHEFKEKRD